MKYNLRNLLWHMKHKGLKDEAERIAECKEQLYDAIEDNVNYFTNWKENCLSGTANMYYSIPMSHFEPFWGLTLDKFLEIKDRFNKSATGLFGFQYDNCAEIVLTDIYGRPFRANCYKGFDKSYELCIYSMDGGISLYRLTTKNPQLTREQVNEMQKCHDNLMEYYDQQKASANRYQHICKYKDYIRRDNYSKGYAQYTCDVYVRKDIPIELTDHEIAKYIDGWNYCFGGKISAIGETDTERMYRVTVYTD